MVFADCFISEYYLLMLVNLQPLTISFLKYIMCCNRHGCVEEILTIAAMLSVEDAIFYCQRVSDLIIFIYVR